MPLKGPQGASGGVVGGGEEREDADTIANASVTGHLDGFTQWEAEELEFFGFFRLGAALGEVCGEE